jgi:hypothetical protein
MQESLDAVSLRAAVSEQSGAGHDAAGDGWRRDCSFLDCSRRCLHNRVVFLGVTHAPSTPSRRHSPARLTFDNPTKHHRSPLQLASPCACILLLTLPLADLGPLKHRLSTGLLPTTTLVTHLFTLLYKRRTDNNASAFTVCLRLLL